VCIRARRHQNQIDDNVRNKSDRAEKILTTDIQAALTVIGRRAAGLGFVDLFGADIDGANFWGANLSGAFLSDAKLSHADLQGANLYGANFYGAKLDGANLSDAIMDGVNVSATNGGLISQGQLDKACGNKGTRLPSGLTLKPCQ
jgi:uncharacterized protein YjbI with pentapeptide repeats